ncbi:MAG TPA: hypothetical protein VGR63_08980 [Casimicrobiaceae bacterium]|nr:hypothetical protein [Casimicrobiaceae bacterium]
MHGLAELSIAAALLVLSGPCTARRAAVAGFLCALIPCVRQPDVVLAAGLGLYGLWWARRRMIPLFVAGGLLPVVLVMAYNLTLPGPLLGALGLETPRRIAAFLSDDVVAGVAGLLFSPTRGLFIFSPFLLFILIGLPWIAREREFRGLTVITGCAALLQLVLYGFGDWRQGVSWGPRWLTDMLPILFWMLPPVLVALPKAGRAAFAVACGLAVAIEVVGAFWYTGTSAAPLFATRGPEAMRAAWHVGNAPFIAELRHPRAPSDLLVDLRGNVDLVAVHADPDGNARRHITAHGWALASHHTPADVAVRVDGRQLAGTSSFFARPDVVRTLGEQAASGWRITFPTDGLAPGPHTLAVLVRPMQGGETRLLKQQIFTLTAADVADVHGPDLAIAARWAARRLIGRQQAPGYWLTAFTPAPRFDDVHQEMNTFLNAVLVDVLDPVAEAAGLVEPIAHARSFLARQIEDDGLVRYHGRPDAPTIGTLGCAITPDTDDTALVWRVAPGARKDLLRPALATIGRFRTPDGLYRTWLAPRDRYQCLDPGTDPNPADIAIQIHLLMLLAEADPPAAHALCDALRRRVDDDAVWVYYKAVPTIVVLRLADARKAGCPLELPSSRLQTTVPGQAVWIDAVERLQHPAAGDRAAARPGTTDLLRRLAANDFALLARDPPLLYHNDRTATVSRYYWSEDFGYALWLRLYFESERAQAAPPCRRSDASPACAGK